MKFILSDNEQVEGYAKLLNLTTRSDMADNKYFEDIGEVIDFVGGHFAQRMARDELA